MTNTMYTAADLESKNKAELRELCRENGIGYNGLNNEGMRAALLTVPAGDNAPGGSPQDEQVVEQIHNPELMETPAAQGAREAAEPVTEQTLMYAGMPTFPAPAAPAVAKRTIEPGRPERNGVKRPSAGTICAQIWAWCDKEHDTNGKVNAKDLRAALAGLDDTTKTVQFYRWRKFNGIQGRQ